MAHSRLSDPEYRNWVTVGRAIQITRNGLETIIQNAADKYHTSLLANWPNSVPTWEYRLKNAHRSRDKRKISWINSDSTQWLTVGGSWEIAKIFMAPLGRRKLDVVSAKTTDISGLLNILEWSPRGTNGIFNTGVDLSKIADARSARNLWAHAPLLRVTDADKVNAFASLTSLLQDPELHHDKDVQDAINKLTSLLNTGLAVIEEKELELFVQLKQQLGQDIVSLGSDMSCWKDEVGANLEQIKDQIKGLDEFVKKNELQDALKTVDKRISHLEDSTITTNSRLEKLEAISETQQLSCDVKQELKFNPVSDRMKEEFVGREWLFSDIHNWLEKDLGPRESRAFLIWGGAGTGKSSFAQEFVRRHEGEKLAGYHYCQKDNPRTCDLESLVYSVRSMLSKNLPEYASLVQTLQTDKFGNDPNALFDLLITTPLQQLNENTKHFLIIDGLDEGGAKIASCFARLSGTLPSWLRVILTVRHNAPALSGLFLNSTSANLDHLETSLESLSSKDIREFVSMKYRKLQTEYDCIPSFFANDEQVGKEKIVQASQNCFLYAKLVMEHIFDGHNEIGFPASLSEIYCLDFRRHFSDIEFFEKRVAPVLQIVLAIQSAKAFIRKEMCLMFHLRASEHYKQIYEESDESVTGVVKCGLLPEIKMHDLNKTLELLSGYLVKDDSGTYYFSHSSVRDWLQDEKSQFFCDVLNGHSIMANYNLKTLKVKYPSPGDFGEDLCFYAKKPYPIALLHLKFFSLRYLFHSSESGSSNVNVLISELGIKAIHLLHAAHLGIVGRFKYLALKVLDETDVLNEMTTKEKAEHLACTTIRWLPARIIAKFFDSVYWIFSRRVIFHLNYNPTTLQLVPNESLPQLFFSNLNIDYFHPVHKIFQFCLKRGLTADVCVPQFFENTKGFDSSICWNEDVQEYFKKLKSGEKNVITLESLKEKPFYPTEARVSEFTLEIIQKPLSGIDYKYSSKSAGVHGEKNIL
jgi:prefoldin subunit 5